MKAKISKGSSFRGCLDYVTGKRGAERIGGTLAGRTAREMSREMGVARRLREDIGKPVWHASLSLPKGEHLDTERWNRVCMSFLAQMGLLPPEEHPWTAWRHTDGEYDHVHLVVNRISLTGAVWDAGLDVYKAITATREIEKSFGLTITPGRENKKFGEPSLKRGEVEQAVREQKAPVKVRVSDALKLSLEGKPDTRTFVRRMQEYGVDAVPNIASTGRMNGFSFEYQGVALKGSDVGAAWKYLREAIDYDVQRDSQLLLDLKKGRGTAGVKKDGGANRRNPNGYDLGIEAGRGEPEARNRSTDGSGVESRPEVGKGIVYPPTGIKRGSDSDGGELEETAPQPAMVRPFDASGVDEWTALVGGIDEIARHQQSFVQADSTSRAVKEVQGWERLKRIKALPTESLQIKMGKVLDELDALGCPEYRITCVVPKTLQGGVDSKGKKLYSKNLCREKQDSPEVFFKRGEEEKWLGVAEHFNDEGRDVYITPVDPNHYYLLVDDLDAEKVQQMKASGVTPCLTVESSKGNFHSVIKVPRSGSDGERDAANKLVKELNQTLGGDLRVSGCEHMFRLSGFQSKKKERQGWRVRLAEVNPGVVCQKTSERLRELITVSQQEQEKKKVVEKRATLERKPSAPIGAEVPLTSPSLGKKYFDAWQMTRLVFEKKGWEKNKSSMDFHTAKDLLYKGWSQEEVVAGMVSGSPDVKNRHPKTWKWAQGVVSDAWKEVAPLLFNDGR
jgi:hypothetical protein